MAFFWKVLQFAVVVVFIMLESVVDVGEEPGGTQLLMVIFKPLRYNVAKKTAKVWTLPPVNLVSRSSSIVAF